VSGLKQGCSANKKDMGLNASEKIAVLKHLQCHFKAKREKGVGTPFPRVPAPLHPWLKAKSLLGFN